MDPLYLVFNWLTAGLTLYQDQSLILWKCSFACSFVVFFAENNISDLLIKFQWFYLPCASNWQTFRVSVHTHWEIFISSILRKLARVLRMLIYLWLTWQGTVYLINHDFLYWNNKAVNAMLDTKLHKPMVLLL